MEFDTALFTAIHRYAGASRLLDFAAVFAAEYLPYILLVVFGYVVWFGRPRERRLDRLFFSLFALILSRGIITEVVRVIVERPRPFAALEFAPLIGPVASYSFPSGHAAVFFAVGMILFYIRRRLGVWFLVLAGLIGIARVFVGVHWPLDIVAGALVGVVSAYLARKFVPGRPTPRFNQGVNT